MRLLEALSISLFSSTTLVAAWDGSLYQDRDLYVRDPYPNAYADHEAWYPPPYVSPQTSKDGSRVQERNVIARDNYPFVYADAEVPYSGSRRDLYIRDGIPSAFVHAEVSYSGPSSFPGIIPNHWT